MKTVKTDAEIENQLDLSQIGFGSNEDFRAEFHFNHASLGSKLLKEFVDEYNGLVQSIVKGCIAKS